MHRQYDLPQLQLLVVSCTYWSPGHVLLQTHPSYLSYKLQHPHQSASESIANILNTLRMGDADLRFYVTTVQDG